MKMDKIFLVKACSANWFKHVPGSLDDETGDFYTKGSGWFVTDLGGMIDWCAAEGISALAVENFLSDRHDNYLSKARGFDHARRVCSYARSKGVKLWLVTPRRSDGLVYRELYDQPEGFDLLTPAHVRKELPDFTVQFLGSSKSPDELAERGINGVDFNHAVYKIHRKWYRQARSHGMSVNAWTVNKEKDMVKMFKMGVDQLTTDNPLEARELMKKMKIKEL